MSDWLDAMAGVIVVDVSVDVLSLPWPVEALANEFQGSGSARVSRGFISKNSKNAPGAPGASVSFIKLY